MASVQQPDLVIRGGTIVDGTGAPPFVGDIAIKGHMITHVGAKLEVRGIEEYEACGLVVAPGWIDAHTHMDAQWSWDPYLSPCAAIGVTTCIMGNCGIGFAPCQRDRREFLAHLVEAVEDIPGPVIAKGLRYDFETFEEYLQSIERAALACDVAVMVGHSAVRTWVMGKRANLADTPQGTIKNPVQPHEVQAIAALVRDAVAAGALGFSTSRLLLHRDPEGMLTPGALAGSDELCSICDAIAEGGGGVFQMSTDMSTYDDFGSYARMDHNQAKSYRERETAWMTDIAKRHGRKVAFTFNLIEGQERFLPFLTEINDFGGLAKGQCLVRAQGFLISFKSRIQPFIVSRTFHQIKHQSHTLGTDLLAELKRPEARDKILHEASQYFTSQVKGPAAELKHMFMPFSMLFPWTSGYEPDPKNDSLEGIAKHSGGSPLEIAYNIMVDGGLLWKPFTAYRSGNYEAAYQLFHHPHIIPGFADAGAHGTVFQDAAGSTHLLSFWARDRTRGQRLSLERAVHLHTQAIAQLFGLHDRGVLAPGMKADINVLDFKALKMCPPYIAQDMPLGQTRWNQSVEGYHLTLLSGTPTFKHGIATGTLPGCLVRNFQRDPAAWQGISSSVSGPFENSMPVPKFENIKGHAIEGSGKGGASAVARVLRNTVEKNSASKASRL